MKILEINTSWPHRFTRGGGETYFLYFVQELISRDLEISILVNDFNRPGINLIDLIKNDLSIKNIKKKYTNFYITDHPILKNIILPNSIDRNLWRFANPYNPIPLFLLNPFFVIKFVKFLKKEKFDFIHVHNLRTWTNTSLVIFLDFIYKFILKNINRPGFILTDHNTLAWPFPQILISKIDILALVSRSSYLAIKTWGKNVTNNVNYIYGGYDFKRFKLLNYEAREIDIVFLGRIVPAKGLDILIESLYILKKKGITPKVFIGGTVSNFLKKYYQYLKDKITEYDLSNVILERKSFTYYEMVEIFNNSKIVVLPSVIKDFYGFEYGKQKGRFSELFPLTLLEASACGCIPVSSRIEGVDELIKMINNELMAEPNNPKSLADVLEKTLENTLIMNLQKRTLEIVNLNFRWKNVIDRFIQSL